MAMTEIDEPITEGVYKWDRVGKTLTGVFKGVKDGNVFNGKKTFLGLLETPEGEVTFGLPKKLLLRIEQVKAGEKITITFTGEKPNRGGMNPTKLFSVQADR